MVNLSYFGNAFPFYLLKNIYERIVHKIEVRRFCECGE